MAFGEGGRELYHVTPVVSWDHGLVQSSIFYGDVDVFI